MPVLTPTSLTLSLILVLIITTLMTSRVTCQRSQPRRHRNNNDNNNNNHQHHQQQPNIIILLADDLGWADVEAHDGEMRTPALTQLARGGMVLNSSYVLPTCAPTRSALLTGRYPYTYGMQVNEIKGARKAWLDESLTLLPATLGDLGYATHMIGKWHLGFCDWSLTPTRRGFDTFYGFYRGLQGYFNHSGNSRYSFDFRDNDDVVWSARGHYSTELHTARAQRIIREHRHNSDGSHGGNEQRGATATGQRERPFFLYMAYQNAHAPFEAKESYVTRYCSHVTNVTRQTHCAMVAAMDESIANITRTLEEEGYSDNTLIVFMSDNGGPTEGGSFNYPLRGKKATLWEGGTRSYSLLSSPLLAQRNCHVYPGLIHAVDWYPTFVQAAGGNVPPGLDGVPMWNQLRQGGPSPRTEFVYNIDDKNNRSALRWNEWKLTEGRPGWYNGWYPPPSLLERGVPWEEVHTRHVPRWQLFNLASDPEERHNVYGVRSNRQVVRTMKRKLRHYKRRLQRYRKPARGDGSGNPRNTGGVFSPGWCQV